MVAVPTTTGLISVVEEDSSTKNPGHPAVVTLPTTTGPTPVAMERFGLAVHAIGLASK